MMVYLGASRGSVIGESGGRCDVGETRVRVVLCETTIAWHHE
jgi:hypothetical protein